MAVIIGTTTWDRHTGTITPDHVGVDVEAKDDGSIRLKATARTAGASGTVTTTKYVADEAAAYLLNALASALVDGYVTVSLEGVVFTSVRVDGVQIRQEKTRAGDGSLAVLVTATWTFAASAQDGDLSEVLVKVKVETRRNWADAWVYRTTVRCPAVADQCGTAPVSALLLQQLDPDDATDAPLDILGHYVRISLPSDNLIAPTTFSPRFHGRIMDRHTGTSGSRVLVSYSCLDLTAQWDTYLLAWYERDAGAIVDDPGEIPPFNARPGGDRSAAVNTQPDPDRGVYVHDRELAPGLPWRASQILETLFMAFSLQFTGGPKWYPAGQTTALDNVIPVELDGMSVREQVGQLINRGLGWRVTVDGLDNVQLQIRSPLKTAITAGGYTIPANDAQVNVDIKALADADALAGWNLGEDTGRMRDRIAIQMAHRWDAISLGITAADNGQLRRTWDDALAVTRNAAAADKRDDPSLAHVYRRFQLHRQWLGGSYKHPTQDYFVSRAVATNATHGVAGEDGTFNAGTSSRFPWAQVRFGKVLPYTVGSSHDWTGDPAYITVDHNEAPALPTAYVVTSPGTAAESWAVLDLEVTVDDAAPAIILGRDATDGDVVKAALAAGKDIVVTLGVYHPKPWRVSWRRDPAAQLVDQGSTILYQRPDVEWRYMHLDTVVGLNNRAPRLAAVAGNIGVKSTLPIDLLALARVHHERPFRDLTWTKSGVIDLSTTYQPGTLIADATLPYGGGSGTVVTVDALVTVQAWNLDSAKPATTWAGVRMSADVTARPNATGQAAPPLLAAAVAAQAYGG